MYYNPLFNISDINHGLHRRVRALDQIRELRLQLYSLKDFVQTCRHCNSLWMDFEKHPSYLLKEIDTYSVCDLVQMKSGEMAAKLKKLVQEALNHINHCEV
uniref:Rubicon Homology domain-containing protein n=1 Tax=Strigamia maritima TaxID=126957 RepID=T1IQA2_STRMM